MNRSGDNYNASRVAGAALYRGGLFAGIFLAPTLWGRFDALGGALVLAMFCVAAAGALAGRRARLFAGGLPLASLHWALGALLAISIVSYFFSLSRFASAVDLMRLAAGALAFWLVVRKEEELSTEQPPRASAPDYAADSKKKRRKEKGHARRAKQAKTAAETAASLGATIFAVLVGLGVAVYNWQTYYATEPVVLLGLLVAGFLLIAIGMWKRPQQIGAVQVALVGAGVVAAYGIYDWGFAYWALGNKTWQPFSTFYNPNSLAGFLGLGLFLALGETGKALEKEGRQKKSYLWGLCVVLLAVVCLLPTNSKGTYLSIYLTGLVFLLVAAGAVCLSRRTRLLVILLLLFLGLALPAGMVAAHPRLRAKAGAALGLQNKSNMFRYLTWRATVDMAQARPWVGVGPGAFEYGFGQYAIAGYTRRAHQNYLETAAETGWAGLAALLWLMGAALVGLGRAIRRAEGRADKVLAGGALGAMLVMMIHSLLDYDWYIGANLVYFFIACGVGMAAGRKPAQEEGPPLRAGWRAAIIVLLALVAARALLIGWAEGAYYKARQAAARADSWQAVRHLQTAVRLAPNYGRAYLELAKYSQGAERIALVEKAIAREPTYAYYYLMLGKSHEYENDLAAAQGAYAQATEYNPQYLSAWMARAQTALALRRPEEAIAAYRAIVEIEAGPVGRYPAIDYEVKTEFAEAHYGLGAAIQEGFLPEGNQAALAHFRAALEVLDEFERVGVEFLRQRRAIGAGETGLEARMAALRAKCYYRMAEALQTEGRTEEAAKMRAAAQKINPAIEAAMAAERQVWHP